MRHMPTPNTVTTDEIRDMTFPGTDIEHRRPYIQNVVDLAGVNETAKLVSQCHRVKIGS